MSFAGAVHTYQIDYNSLSSDDTVGTLVRFSDSPLQTQLFPPKVGDVVIADDPDVGVPVWATVVERHNDWMLLKLGSMCPWFRESS